MFNQQDFESNSNFMRWLEQYLPEWELEYTGNVESMYAAWYAGYCQCQKDNDIINDSIDV